MNPRRAVEGVIESDSVDVAAITLKQVSKTFQSASGSIEVLRNINLDVSSGSRICLLGASGAGKTTLVHICAGFERPSAGEAFLCGEPVEHLSVPVPIGVVQQRDSLFPNLRVLENAAFGAPRRNEAEANEIAAHWLSRVGLGGVGRKWPRELSGGMRRRVELARALASEPLIFLLDEPFSSLDILTREEMQALLLELWSDRPVTTLFATHDIEEAIFLGKEVIVLSRAPAEIAARYQVPFADPRFPELRLTPAFIELRAEITNCVRKYAAPRPGELR